MPTGRDMLPAVRGLRGVTHRGGERLRAVLPPKSRVKQVVWGEIRSPVPTEFAHFGQASYVLPPARVSGARHIWVGEGVLVMEHSEIRAAPAAGSSSNGALLHFGDGTRLARFATIWAAVGVHFGERVSSSDNVAVVDCWSQPDGPASSIATPLGAPVTIEDGAYLGFGCVIGPGVTVGSGAFVGEGAVVLSDVPPHSVVYGNPAAGDQALDRGRRLAG